MSEPSPDTKMELLWRDYEARQQARETSPKGLFSGLPDRMLIYLLMAAMALGMGPETASKLLNFMVPK